MEDVNPTTNKGDRSIIFLEMITLMSKEIINRRNLKYDYLADDMDILSNLVVYCNHLFWRNSPYVL